MELFQVDVTGYRKFREKTSLKTRGKVLAVLGANEAGKSSLLSALQRLRDSSPFQLTEVSRGLTGGGTLISARFLLSDADRVAAGVPAAIWFTIDKEADGQRYWSIEPRPANRDYAHRPRLHSKIVEIRSKKRLASSATEHDADILSETETFLERLKASTTDLNDNQKEVLSGLVKRWVFAKRGEVGSQLRAFADELAAMEAIEVAESQFEKAGNILWDRMPDFLLFGQNDRALKSSYSWDKLKEGGVPAALANLARVAGLDLVALMEIKDQNKNDPQIDTLIDDANKNLEEKFSSWGQSKVSVVLSYRDDEILVQVYNNERQRTDFSQRSDGLRQFVALCSFTSARDTDNFILLIDEAEQHLHYDAQADLVQMLANQTVASKVIYTTHSVGCLPEDLGNGVRLVEPTSRFSDWSRIENKFWSKKDVDEAAFSPILMGMGASTMAFFPTRSAVLVEGPADTILLPTMFREALGISSVGVQFIHGLSEDSRLHLPLLNSTGRQVCYLLDNDPGGRTLKADLKDRKVELAQVFLYRRSGGDCELEDFVHPSLLAEAATLLGSRHLETQGLVPNDSMPKYGKWDHIEAACKAANVNVLSKVEVAYAVLDLLDADPSRPILDGRLKQSFKATAQDVLAKATSSKSAPSVLPA